MKDESFFTFQVKKLPKKEKTTTFANKKVIRNEKYPDKKNHPQLYKREC